ncbi:hypothetical protein NIES4074_43220 [Cylindrospermum sp. NIES-4074]|nr:hypothetical protein NIES4074_43220 [Cylindrospermum sp. NIES-4074]
MSNLKIKLSTDEWVTATWEEYLETINDPTYANAKSYYYDGQLRLEMIPQGYDHSFDNSFIGYALALLSAIKGIPMSAVTNCSFRKTGEVEFQPDLAFYLGANAEIVPANTSVVDLDIYPPPDLVVEIAKTSVADDLGVKRLLYERLGVSEYWVVDVRKAQLIALAIANCGSRQITQSLILPDLSLNLLVEGLRRSRETGRSNLYAWLLSQLQT